MSLEPDAVVVRTLATLSCGVPEARSNKSISSSSSLESIEMAIDCVLAGRVLSGFDFRGDFLNPLEPKSSRGFPAPGAIPVLGGRACMRRDGSESMVRPVRENWRSTCSMLRPLSLRRRAGCGMRSLALLHSRDGRVAFPSAINVQPRRDAGSRDLTDCNSSEHEDVVGRVGVLGYRPSWHSLSYFTMWVHLQATCWR